MWCLFYFYIQQSGYKISACELSELVILVTSKNGDWSASAWLCRVSEKVRVLLQTDL